MSRIRKINVSGYNHWLQLSDGILRSTWAKVGHKHDTPAEYLPYIDKSLLQKAINNTFGSEGEQHNFLLDALGADGAEEIRQQMIKISRNVIEKIERTIKTNTVEWMTKYHEKDLVNYQNRLRSFENMVIEKLDFSNARALAKGTCINHIGKDGNEWICAYRFEDDLENWYISRGKPVDRHIFNWQKGFEFYKKYEERK